MLSAVASVHDERIYINLSAQPCALAGSGVRATDASAAYIPTSEGMGVDQWRCREPPIGHRPRKRRPESVACQTVGDIYSRAPSTQNARPLCCCELWTSAALSRSLTVMGPLRCSRSRLAVSLFMQNRSNPQNHKI